MPGFLNLKYDPTNLVTVQYPDSNTSNPDDFRLDISATNPMISKPHIPPGEYTANRVIRNSIGLGFCMNLPAGKTP